MYQKISQADIDELEFETTQAYDALARAIDSGYAHSVSWARSLYDALYSVTLPNMGFFALNMRARNGSRPHVLEGYFLQVIIGHAATQGSVRPRNGFQTANLNLQELVEDRSIPYVRIEAAVSNLSEGSNFGEILSGMNRVRELYWAPQIIKAYE